MPSNPGHGCCGFWPALAFLVAALLDPRLVLADEVKATCHAQCYDKGTCNQELGRCDCCRGLTGPACNETTPEKTLKLQCSKLRLRDLEKCTQSELPCLNACNQRGTCVAGWCHCQPGYWGADCSLSAGSDGKPELLGDLGYVPRQRRPWIYVYDLPPELSSWHNPLLMDRPLHWHFWQRLLSSGAQVADGEVADWYFVPVRMRGTSDGYNILKAVGYLREHWPWWDRHQGARHFFIHTGDAGRGEVMERARTVTTNSTWLHHWGLYEEYEYSNWHKAHRPGQDIVVPIYIVPTSKPEARLDASPLHPATPPVPRTQTFLFAGRICGDQSSPSTDGSWPNCETQRNRGYSQGVRQTVHFHHHNRTGFKVVQTDHHYAQDLAQHKFCLAPTGGGHGHRQVLVALVGCVPVLIGDFVKQPFEPELPWPRFSVSVQQDDIPRLHEVLDAVSEEQYQGMQDSLRCAAQHFLFSTMGGGMLSETGRYDAFEMILETLRMQASHPGVDPAQYADLDPDYRSFINCGFDDIAGLGKQLREAAGADADAAAVGSGATAIDGAIVGGQGRAAGAHVCSFSEWDDRPARSCRECKMKQNLQQHDVVPGGIMCCAGTNLAQCPRIWS